MIDVVMIDCGSGNLRSVAKALQVAAGETGQRIRVSADPYDVRKADYLVLPGVGAFAECRRGLDARKGLAEATNEAVLQTGKPILGICVGMQLMATKGYEHGVHAGLGWIPGEVVHLASRAEDAASGGDQRLRIPHMGWNELQLDRLDHPVLAGLASGCHVYFLHSYQFLPKDPGHRLATVEYGGLLTAAVARDNMIGTQFHPEKSQAVGLRLLESFLKWRQ